MIGTIIKFKNTNNGGALPTKSSVPYAPPHAQKKLNTIKPNKLKFLTSLSSSTSSLQFLHFLGHHSSALLITS